MTVERGRKSNHANCQEASQRDTIDHDQRQDSQGDMKSLSERARGEVGRWKRQPASLHPVTKTCPTVDSTTDRSLIFV